MMNAGTQIERSLDAAQVLVNAKKIVVKVGSSLVSDGERSLNTRFVSSLASELSDLIQSEKKVILVSSGAVALGASVLELGAGLTLEEKQAASAVGQSALIEAWRAAFGQHNITVAQILLTLDDTENRKRYLNAKATINTLLGLGVVPVINENDTIATSEIRYGDNDRLAAHSAQLSSSDLLIILSDVDGLYTADPTKSNDAVFIPRVGEISRAIKSYASGPNNATGTGSGGMQSKLIAAEIASRSGCSTIISSGKIEYPIRAIMNGNRSTLLTARSVERGSRSHWIGGRIKHQGIVVIDDGAADALMIGASLLPIGVVSVQGEFSRGDPILIRDKTGNELGQGLVSYDFGDIIRIAGLPSEKLAERLGYARRPAVVEKDDLFLF